MSFQRVAGTSRETSNSSTKPVSKRPTFLERRSTIVDKGDRNNDSQPAVSANSDQERANVSRSFDFSRIPLFPLGKLDQSQSLPSPGTNSLGNGVPSNVRDNFERTTGTSLAQVRVHTDTPSQVAARALKARAFTVGQNIHFADGEFQPGSPEGDHLLAHELTHTVQQRVAEPRTQLNSLVSRPDDLAEQEAEAIAEAVTTQYVRPDSDEDSTRQKAPQIRTQVSPIALVPKKSAKHKAPKPPAKKKPIVFRLFSTTFRSTMDAGGILTVEPASGWTFTDDGPGAVLAERTPKNAEYVAASGTSDPFVEKTRITVDANHKAMVDPIKAVLGEPAKLTIPLGGSSHALNHTSLTVNGAVVERLDLPAAAITFTPADGDSIHLGLGGDAWVFTTLKQDSGTSGGGTTDVKGFFRVGHFVIYSDHGTTPTPGTDRQLPSESQRRKEIEDLTDPSTPPSRRISDEEADAFKTVATIEGDFANVQTYDSGILTFGFAQWTVNADLPRMLTKVSSDVFERHLGRYGLAVSAPVRQLDTFVAKFVPQSVVRRGLGVRNTSEGALFLNGRELVTKRLLSKASSRAQELQGFANLASTLKADVVAAKQKLSSTSKAAKKAFDAEMKPVTKQLGDLAKKLHGLPGSKKERDPEAMAETLHTVADDAHSAAGEVNANCDSSQVMRQSEWALRFQMLGQDPGGQDAELAQARETLTKVKNISTHSVNYGTLLPSNRGRAALLSSYLNNPAGTRNGMERSVDKFKAQRRAEAKNALATALAAKTPPPPVTEADWAAFPWKAGDARWSTIWQTEQDAFEKVAILEMTKGTTNPTSRRRTIAQLFP